MNKQTITWAEIEARMPSTKNYPALASMEIVPDISANADEELNRISEARYYLLRKFKENITRAPAPVINMMRFAKCKCVVFLDGFMAVDSKTIYINPHTMGNLSDDEMLAVLIHELCHHFQWDPFTLNFMLSLCPEVPDGEFDAQRFLKTQVMATVGDVFVNDISLQFVRANPGCGASIEFLEAHYEFCLDCSRAIFQHSTMALGMLDYLVRCKGSVQHIDKMEVMEELIAIAVETITFDEPNTGGGGGGVCPPDNPGEPGDGEPGDAGDGEPGDAGGDGDGEPGDGEPGDGGGGVPTNPDGDKNQPNPKPLPQSKDVKPDEQEIEQLRDMGEADARDEFDKRIEERDQQDRTACSQAGADAGTMGLPELPRAKPIKFDYVITAAVRDILSTPDYEQAVRGLVVMNEEEQKINVCVMLDVSGSVVYDKEAWSALTSGVQTIADLDGIDMLTIIAYDHGHIRESNVVLDASGQNLARFFEQFSGGGGTSFDPPFRKFNELHERYDYDCVFNLTDGHASYTDGLSDLPAVWLYTAKSTAHLDSSGTHMQVSI